MLELQSTITIVPKNLHRASLAHISHHSSRSFASTQLLQCLHVPRISPALPKKTTASSTLNRHSHQSQKAWHPSAPTRRPLATQSFPSAPPSRIMHGASVVLIAELHVSPWSLASSTRSILICPMPSFGSALTRRYVFVGSSQCSFVFSIAFGHK